MILGDLEFKAEDFLGIDMSYQNDERIGSRFGLTTVQASRVAEAANRLLRERLEKALQVWEKSVPIDKEPYSIVWTPYENDEGVLKYKKTGFTARLVCVEEMK